MVAKAILIFYFSLSVTISFSWAQEKEGDTQEKEIETKEVNVAIGIDKIIEVEFPLSADLSIGDPSLLKIKPDIKRKKITLIGTKSGNTSLTLKDEAGEERLRYIVSVTANDQSKIVTELRELLSDVEGLEIGIKGGKVYVGGYIVVPGDIGKVATILSKYPDVLRLVEMHPQTQQIIAQKMTEELARFNLKNVSVRVVNNSYWVEGVVGNDNETKMVQQITQAYLPEKVEKLSASSERIIDKPDSFDILYFITKNEEKSSKPEPLPKQVKISTQFVELSKDYNKVFGFKWAPLLSDGGANIRVGKRTDGTITTNSENGFSAVISNLFPKIQSLKNAGYGRVIQSGVVVTHDKKKGDVEKRTRIPIVVGTNEAARSQEVDFTFKFEVTPEVKQEDNVFLDFKLTVALPSGQSDDGNPLSTSNSIATQLIVKSGQSAVVGGVVQSQDLTSYDKNDPAPLEDSLASSVFFRFLRSKSKALSKNQYVVFVTPEIIQSASSDTAEIRKKFRRVR